MCVYGGGGGHMGFIWSHVQMIIMSCHNYSYMHGGQGFILGSCQLDVTAWSLQNMVLKCTKLLLWSLIPTFWGGTMDWTLDWTACRGGGGGQLLVAKKLEFCHHLQNQHYFEAVP